MKSDNNLPILLISASNTPQIKYMANSGHVLCYTDEISYI